ncbi:MAG: ABC transporter ATP-binding protein [Halothiobacillaceae bacterium]
MSAPLALDQLCIDIPGRPAPQPLNLEIGPGQGWVILGPNGAGKSTLLHHLAGLQAPRSGQVRLFGDPVNRLSRRQVARTLGILLQQRQDEFPATVLEIALMGRHPWLGRWQSESPEDRRIAERALAEVDLSGMETRMLSTLSGGERQRVAIASLLTQDPKVLLLDEPVNHLDLHHQVSILGHLRALREAGRSIVMTLHDLNLTARYATHVLLLYPDGTACWGPVGQMLVPEALERLYCQPLQVGELDGQRVFVPRTG